MTKKLCSTHGVHEIGEWVSVPWRECQVCQRWLKRVEAAWQTQADKLASMGYVCRNPDAHTPLWDGPEGEIVYLARSLGSLDWHVETWESMTPVIDG